LRLLVLERLSAGCNFRNFTGNLRLARLVQ
jgi:hypothetical protein